jgi:arsenate reductase
MAEAWARRLKNEEIIAYSAGIEAYGLNRVAVRVMAEVGIDISHYRSKRLEEFRNVPFDYVVTVCTQAHERCPVFPGKAQVVHVDFDDPPALARNARSEEEALDHYRRVRDEIRAFIETLPVRLTQTNRNSNE